MNVTGVWPGDRSSRALRAAVGSFVAVGGRVMVTCPVPGVELGGALGAVALSVVLVRQSLARVVTWSGVVRTMRLWVMSLRSPFLSDRRPRIATTVSGVSEPLSS